ncbi:MAG: DUF1622 domain-containing protein, partial [Clostridium perfringens]
LSILKPTLYDILLLGSTVALRTVISYFLKKELKSSNANSNLKEENS